MSRLFGPVRQAGYVVSDIEAAMKLWIEALGVGPFFRIPEYPVQAYEFAEQRSHPVLSVAIGYSGPLQIELIQPLGSEPSLYHQLRDAGGPGPHYVTYWVRSLAPQIERAVAHGFERAQSGGVEGAGKFQYLRHRHLSTLIELLETTDAIEGYFDRMRETAARWDGADPIRSAWV